MTNRGEGSIRCPIVYVCLDSVIQISKLNDFIFCPHSIYLHAIYDSFDVNLYKQRPQITGTLHHNVIDSGVYSTSTRYLQGISVYSQIYNLAGKIDIYDTEKAILVERKYKIKTIFDGYRYQLYAEMFGMQEAGYKVKGLLLHSLSDNKRYQIDMPDSKELAEFEELIINIRNYNPETFEDNIVSSKCENCIYKTLCSNVKSK